MKTMSIAVDVDGLALLRLDYNAAKGEATAESPALESRDPEEPARAVQAIVVIGHALASLGASLGEVLLKVDHATEPPAAFDGE